MALKKMRPTSPGRRGQVNLVREEVTRGGGEPSLMQGRQRLHGRNNQGRVTVRYRGGAAKRKYRFVDHTRQSKDGVPAKVAAIDRDPNRNANLALLHYADGDKRYIVAPLGLKPGDQVVSGPGIDIKTGNTLPLRDIPTGTMIHNIELQIGGGGKLCRAAGAQAQLLAKEGDYAYVVLPSKETRLVNLNCRATVGQVGNLDFANIQWGKAGRMRFRGIRSHVRGVARNPVDHPMGGGEGKTSGGRHPCTLWGQPTKGYKTRRRKATSRMIVRSRHAAKKKA
ncbi:MAG TPA: 50S ribosomal protein L2 [bacterium]|nr:50S ribosomal protein L2 [bacterium]